MSRLRIGSRSPNPSPRASGCPGTCRAHGSNSRDTKRGAPSFPDITTRGSTTSSGKNLPESWSLTDRRKRVKILIVLPFKPRRSSSSG
eukprot:5493849-Amphidinium_carterae.1